MSTTKLTFEGNMIFELESGTILAEICEVDGRTTEEVGEQIIGPCNALAATQAALKQAVEALENIVAAEPKPIDDPFPADWDEQIKTCPECQGWAKNHPIQKGICDLHRKPIWERERREKNARRFLPLDMKDIARAALAAQPHLPAQREALG